jgi:hypothetical protein
MAIGWLDLDLRHLQVFGVLAESAPSARARVAFAWPAFST